MKAPVQRMHFAGADGVPICRRLWRAHTKNKPEITKHRECVTCAQCVARLAPTETSLGTQPKGDDQ